MRLLFVLDSHYFGDDLMQVAQKAAPYVDAMWFRIKDEADAFIYDKALALRRALPWMELSLSARADIAYAAGFDGVQLNSGSLPPCAVKAQFTNLIVGYSAHSAAECLSLEADRYTLSPIFPSYKSVGCETFGVLPAPQANVYALGGIGLQNIAKLAGLGYRGVAGISLYKDLPELAEQVKKL